MDMPEVISVVQDTEQRQVRLQLAISPELDGFEGHFVGAPIVPGVMQIYWALQFANIYLERLTPHVIAHMEAVKFQHIMTPGIEVLLELALTDANLVFEFSSPSRRYSSGKIVLTS